MTYWHMQLHPDEAGSVDEKELLEKKALIGLGDWEGGKSQIEQFKSEMQIGDIVLIKRGSKPIALVKVIGEFEDIGGNTKNLDWFQYRREIKVLEFLNEDKYDFPSPRGTLKKSIDKYTPTYQYIDNWYKKISNPNSDDLGFKIEKITIDSYKILNDFTIDFLDKNSKPLPIVIIAGKNGTGKTTLFEYLTNLPSNKETYKVIYKYNTKSYDCVNNEKFVLDGGFADGTRNLYKYEFQDNLIYLSAKTISKDSDETKNLEALILKYIDYFIYTKGESAFVGYEALQNNIDEIFEGFDLNFQFKKINYEDKRALFENNNSIRDDIEFNIENLSTGEQTLLSKVLNLYLKEIKNKVILIDEPELSLHPSWQNRVLKLYENFAEKNNCQIIIATHSPHIIGSAKNEYLRLLRFNKETNKVEVVDSNLYAHGRDINSILFDVMGEVLYRPNEFREKIDNLYYEIDNKNFIEAQKLLDNLAIDYGKKDSVIMEAQMLIDMFSKE